MRDDKNQGLRSACQAAFTLPQQRACSGTDQTGSLPADGKRTTIKNNTQDSLVAQWLRIRLPMQGTRVRALVREDPTCRGATKPVRHNY